MGVIPRVARRGFEPLTSSLKGKRPGPLGDRAAYSKDTGGASVQAAVVLAGCEARAKSGDHADFGSQMSCRMRAASTTLTGPPMSAASATPNAIPAPTLR